jgi:tetratricopeptide (TPR) repeat protein
LTRLASDIARFRRLGLLEKKDSATFDLIEGRAAVLLAMSFLDPQRPSPAAESQLKQSRDVIAPRYPVEPIDDKRRRLWAAGALASALAVFPKTPEPAAVEPLRKQIGRAVEVLSSAPEPGWFGQCGRYWIAEGYWKLGIPSAAMASYQESLQRSPYGHWSQKMRRRVLDYQLATKDPDVIQRQYQALISTASAERRLEYQTARVRFWLDSWEKMTEGDPDSANDCLQWSKEVYDATEPPEKKREMLEVMGLVYEKMGDFDNALKCFDGTWKKDP